MTEDLFREDALLHCCEARVTSVGEAGIGLDRTVFYPLGGGQAGDRGLFRLADGRELIIADTRKARREDGSHGDIVHVAAPGQEALQAALGAGDPVFAQIDAGRRMRHMRFHTATHLLCVQPPRGLGRVRILEIEGVDPQPCGGTHVPNTEQIGHIAIVKIEKKVP